MSSLHQGGDASGSDKKKSRGTTVEPPVHSRVESAGRTERREIDVLFASIDFLNYLVLKLLVLAVVCLIHN
jgi:hypothetical protein